MDVREAAILYRRAGLCVLPAILAEKRPAVRAWKQYQKRLPTAQEVAAWSFEALCLVCGAVSGNLEMIDFDGGGLLYDAWAELVNEQDQTLLPKLVIERSQSGGRHVVYRCCDEASKNLKLAQRVIESPDGQPVTIGGRTYACRRSDGRFQAAVTLIETRGEGGLFLCHPSPGYELLQGAFEQLPVLTGRERGLLLSAAWSLNEAPIETPSPPGPSGQTDRPGDDFNRWGDVRTVLERHGWSLVRDGENQYWRRPGKSSGWSATLKNRVFFVFSQSAAPFKEAQGYSPFAVYSLLEHEGDFEAAAGALRKQGFGDGPACDVDLSGILASAETAGEAEDDPNLEDPGPIPEHMFCVPGFVGEVTDFCLAISPYPSLALAFCGAMALQSFLCGRKVRETGDLRTNLYLLALAGASTGKDHPRKISACVLYQIGQVACLGDKFASGEGIQDAMFLNPSMLFQNDEIDGLLQAVKKGRDSYHENIIATLLTMYTSSSSIYPMRRKAGAQHPGVIDQPHLTLFGTATAKYYYEALSERMLTNGFFARLVIVDVGKRGRGQTAGAIDSLPERILATAGWWRDFEPGERRGNLIEFHPIPAVVPYAPEAESILDEFRDHADQQYSLAEDALDEVSKTVWGRAGENARKLALVYACSERHQDPVIGPEAARWAVAFVDHQIRRMLFMAQEYVAKNDFDAMCKELLRQLRRWHERYGWNRWMPEWELNRRLSWRPRDHEEVRQALQSQQRIDFRAVPTKTRPRPEYRLL